CASGIQGKDVYILGFVTKRWKDSTGIIWCRVAIPTYPAIFTGNLIKIRENDLIYTGRFFRDTAITFISFGSK
ncbi:MAG: hypothetical protein U1A26_00115, partial [Candidatus Sungbacteria bacterium]|nr:hypothetical protein [Candidatus Sungbacteria bacterium]